MSTGEFFVGWLVLVAIVVCAIYFGPRLRRRAGRQTTSAGASAPQAATVAVPQGAVHRAEGEEPSVPRPSEPLQFPEPVVAARTTDPSSVKAPGPLPKWFSRKLKREQAPAEVEFVGDFNIDPTVNEASSTRFDRQSEIKDVPTELQAVETNQGAQLRTLDGLRAQGFITDEEYEQRRAAILGS